MLLANKAAVCIAVFAFALAGCAAPSKVDPKVIASTAPYNKQQAIARLMQISSHFQRTPFTNGNRVTLLETALATLLDYLDAVGRCDGSGERLGDQVPAVRQARLVLGQVAWRRIMGVAPAGSHHLEIGRLSLWPQ